MNSNNTTANNMLKSGGTYNCDNVAIFWDIENCPAPARGIFSTGHALVKRMREKTCHFGQIKHIRAYADMSMLKKELRGQLQSSGVHLIEVPHRRKDAADKMIIADLCLFAVDNPPPATIILITGDRDFAYSIAQLAQRGYFIGLVIPSQGAPDELRAQANVIIEWRNGNVVFPDEWTMTEYAVSSKGDGRMKTEPVFYNPLTYTFRRRSSAVQQATLDNAMRHVSVSTGAAAGRRGSHTPSTISELGAGGDAGGDSMDQQTSEAWSSFVEKMLANKQNGGDTREDINAARELNERLQRQSLGGNDPNLLSVPGDDRRSVTSESSMSDFDDYTEADETYDKVSEDMKAPRSNRNSIARRRSSSLIGEFSRFAPLLDVVQSCIMEGIETSSGSSRALDDEAELNEIAQKLRKTMPHWLDDLEVNSLGEYIEEAEKQGIVNVRKVGMQTFVSIPNSRSSHSQSEALTRKDDLDALAEAVSSLKDDCLKPTEQQVRARMRDRGSDVLDERLLTLAQKTRNYQLMYDDGSIVVYPPTGKFESYDPNVLLPVESFSAGAWRGLQEYLSELPKQKAQGRYYYAKNLKEKGSEALRAMPLGKLTCMVQTAVTTRNWLEFHGGFRVRPKCVHRSCKNCGSRNPTALMRVPIALLGTDLTVKCLLCDSRALYDP
eukprot:Nk52_evm22s307 gene=Nk52_evmTU22s307